MDKFLIRFSFNVSLLLFLIVPFLFSFAHAATYFVDYNSGSNTNTGTSQQTAWKNCPGDSACTQLSLSAVLNSGDTIFFKGGVVYKGAISLRYSGKPNSPIVFDGNSSGNFGTGKAIIDGENIRYQGFINIAPTLSYVTIQNFEIKNMKYNSAASWISGAGLRIDNATNIIISDCFIHDNGYWNNDGSIVPAGCGVSMTKPVNCLITGCEITKIGLSAVSLNGAQNCTVSKNNIHDYITWGVDLGGGYQLCYNNTVADNTIHDLWQYDAGFWGAAGDPPHTDYIFIRMGDGQHPVKNIVERNLFYNNRSFTEFGGTAMVFLSYADSCIIRNNVFINPHEYYAIYAGWTSAGTKIYNNTVYAPRTGAIRLESNGNNDIRNNVFVTASENIAYAGSVDLNNLICDFNIYSVANDAQSFVLISPYTAKTFAGWKNMGYDSHSIKVDATANLQFIQTSGYPLACQTMDLHYLSASPTINSGTTISGFSNDKDQTIRPEQNAWDIGAYEFKPTAVLLPESQVNKNNRLKEFPRMLSRTELAFTMANLKIRLFTASGKSINLASCLSGGFFVIQNMESGISQRIILTN